MFCALFELKHSPFQPFYLKRTREPLRLPFFSHSCASSSFKGAVPKVLREKVISRHNKELKVTLDCVPLFERHVENLGDVIMCDGFDNRIHSKIDVRLCSITESNWTIGVRLGSTEFWFDFFFFFDKIRRNHLTGVRSYSCVKSLPIMNIKKVTHHEADHLLVVWC